MRQYTQEIFVGGTVDGRMTLSENIADNGGLVAAYQVREEILPNEVLIRAQMQTVPGLQVFNEETSLHAQFSLAAGSLTRTFLRARSALFHRVCALLLLHDEVSQVHRAGLLNLGWYFRLHKFRCAEGRAGHGPARHLCLR